MKYTVIVAEDEELLLKNMVRKVEKADPDFKVVGTAQTGTRALELIQEEQPDLLITDIRMPVMDGLALLEKVREICPFIKVIITSGFSDFEYAKRAITLKVSEYLLKPVDTEELKEILQRLKNEWSIERNDYGKIFNAGTGRMASSQVAVLLHDFIQKNYADEINLNLIASNMNFSAGYLSRIFCQYYNCTPSKYILNLRISMAQKLLRQSPELSIRQIGECVGYHDQAYFSRIFKKIVGVSPIDYRTEQSI